VAGTVDVEDYALLFELLWRKTGGQGTRAGLEFDYVIVPDANARTYPSAPAARRTLHVAVTRAARQAWLISPGAPSPILPPILRQTGPPAVPARWCGWRGPG
jgi:hypothetical protein